ncbi:MAG: Unknown protein [uncultured Sulfurovum sp.]|uniref:Uncharacterized protein n=1 Tax=uncultured Sulfurovum sp. TaxID=269237 RepID=A0A6S6SY26_9BACT|nr:MAG: Unknown protein [uncultured Sulfurovum sp.]
MMKLLLTLTLLFTTNIMAEQPNTEDSLTQEQRFEMLFGETMLNYRVIVKEKRERTDSRCEVKQKVNSTPSC